MIDWFSIVAVGNLLLFCLTVWKLRRSYYVQNIAPENERAVISYLLGFWFLFTLLLGVAWLIYWRWSMWGEG